MARKSADLDYPITPEWLRDVKEALAPRGAQAKLAREIGCSPGTLNELLKEGRSSVLVPAISRALGLPLPTFILSKDTAEIVDFVTKMGDRGRKALREMKTLDKEQLDAMLAMLVQMNKTKGN